MTHYDVVINGGGMAGAVLALGLSQLTRANGAPLRVALIEHASPNLKSHPGFDARSIALAGHSRDLLVELGLWPLLSDLATPITAIQVTDQGHLGQVNLHAHDYAQPALGYVVELHSIGRRLYDALQNTANIDVLCPTHLTMWQQQTEQVWLQLNDQRELTTQLLVGADGSQSVIAAQLGLERREFDYQQSAIIANVQTHTGHQGRAFERFTAQGPVALLPMSEGRSSLVWCTSNARAAELMALDDDAFMAALQQEFGYRLGRITRTGQRSCYPLVLNEVRRPWHHRVVLVGNAAHLLHPIAGQGFNLGLRDVAALVAQLRQSLTVGGENTAGEVDLGSYPLVSHYGQSRLADQAELVAATSALALLFSNDAPALTAGRNLGLMTMAACTSLKSKLAWRAMGKR